MCVAHIHTLMIACTTACYSMLHSAAVYCSMLQRAVIYMMQNKLDDCRYTCTGLPVHCTVLQHVAVCCSVLHYVAVCCRCTRMRLPLQRLVRTQMRKRESEQQRAIQSERKGKEREKESMCERKRVRERDEEREQEQREHARAKEREGR